MAFTSITSLSPYTFVGATSGTRGAGGLIPTPQAGDQGKFLKGDGTWTNSVDAGSITTTLIQDSAITTAKVNDSAITTAKLAQPLTLGTAQNTTSGTAIDFTGIPSWVKRITVILCGVSTNGTSNVQVQVGSGSISTSGYTNSNGITSAGAVSSNASTSGFVLGNINLAADRRSGHMVITNISGNIWVASFIFGGNTSTTDASCFGGGDITLSGTLDRLRLTTVNGTDAFDAGSVNIMYEG